MPSLFQTFTISQTLSSGYTSCYQKCPCAQTARQLVTVVQLLPYQKEDILTQGPTCVSGPYLLNAMRLNVQGINHISRSTQRCRFISHWQTQLNVSEKIRQTCDHGGKSIADLVPVSSRIAEKVFRNKHGFYEILVNKHPCHCKKRIALHVYPLKCFDFVPNFLIHLRSAQKSSAILFLLVMGNSIFLCCFDCHKLLR